MGRKFIELDTEGPGAWRKELEGAGPNSARELIRGFAEVDADKAFDLIKELPLGQGSQEEAFSQKLDLALEVATASGRIEFFEGIRETINEHSDRSNQQARLCRLVGVSAPVVPEFALETAWQIESHGCRSVALRKAGISSGSEEALEESLSLILQMDVRGRRTRLQQFADAVEPVNRALAVSAREAAQIQGKTSVDLFVEDAARTGNLDLLGQALRRTQSLPDGEKKEALLLRISDTLTDRSLPERS
ncbi:MAG: hypothetical protein Q8Q11_03745 [bacterium]|nr:hypothetical protein [bacterium]MDZ4248342.1 hypothetical protein [Patescibacteria group bacterium]